MRTESYLTLSHFFCPIISMASKALDLTKCSLAWIWILFSFPRPLQDSRNGKEFPHLILTIYLHFSAKSEVNVDVKKPYFFLLYSCFLYSHTFLGSGSVAHYPSSKGHICELPTACFCNHSICAISRNRNIVLTEKFRGHLTDVHPSNQRGV